jgi:hypothetical protein
LVFPVEETTLHEATLTTNMEVDSMEAMKQKTPKKIETATADLSDMLRPYSSGWVALSSDERHVIASAPTLEKAKEKARETGEEHPLFIKVLPPERGYVPVPL